MAQQAHSIALRTRRRPQDFNPKGAEAPQSSTKQTLWHFARLRRQPARGLTESGAYRVPLSYIFHMAPTRHAAFARLSAVAARQDGQRITQSYETAFQQTQCFAAAVIVRCHALRP
jgi:hypothetical protein